MPGSTAATWAITQGKIRRGVIYLVLPSRTLAQGRADLESRVPVLSSPCLPKAGMRPQTLSTRYSPWVSCQSHANGHGESLEGGTRPGSTEAAQEEKLGEVLLGVRNVVPCSNLHNCQFFFTSHLN